MKNVILGILIIVIFSILFYRTRSNFPNSISISDSQMASLVQMFKDNKKVSEIHQEIGKMVSPDQMTAVFNAAQAEFAAQLLKSK